jgi:hypothetical protein
MSDLINFHGGKEGYINHLMAKRDCSEPLNSMNNETFQSVIKRTRDDYQRK